VSTLGAGDLVTSFQETGKKILLLCPIRQPAHSREFAFAVTAKANIDAFQNMNILSCTFCRVLKVLYSIDLWFAFYLVIHFILTRMSATALDRSLNRSNALQLNHKHKIRFQDIVYLQLNK